MKFLVDTSVWIDYLNGRQGLHLEALEELLADPSIFGLTDLIYMEILQGARDQKSFDQLRNYFSSQQFFRTRDPEKTYSGAASIYLNCRKSGVTVRSVVDCLIAQYALEQELILLHHDRDFLQIASIFPKLKQRNFLDQTSA